MSELREQALQRLSKLSVKTLEDIALVIETADVQGDYYSGCGDEACEDSVWEDDTQITLDALAREIRNLR